MNNNRFHQTGWLTLAASAVVCFCLPASGWAAPVTIGFASQTNANSAFVSDTELGFSVTPVLGSFFQSNFGNPGPSIYDGPVGSPGNASIQVTDGGGLFNLNSTDFSSNSGTATYFLFGFNGSTMVYQEVGALPNTSAFATYATTAADAAKSITSLTISLIPGSGTTSINIDNIKVNAVPEPVTTSLLAVGGLSLLACRRWRRGV